MLKRSLLLLSGSIVLMCSLNAQKIAVNKGQKLESVVSAKMTMTMDMMGQSMDNSSDVVTTSEVEVKNVGKDGFQFGNTIKRMVINSSMMGQDVNFDSDKKEDMDGQMGQLLKDKIGKTQDINIDSRGKVIEIAGDTSSAGGGGIGDVMNVNEKLAKGQPYPLLIQLPAKAVKPGDTWTDSSGTLATIKTVTVYTLKEVKAGLVIVSYTGTIAKSGTMQQNGMEIQMDLSGTVKGENSYESASGVLTKGDAVSDIKGTVEVMGQSLPITVKVTTGTTTRKL